MAELQVRVNGTPVLGLIFTNTEGLQSEGGTIEVEEGDVVTFHVLDFSGGLADFGPPPIILTRISDEIQE